MLRLRHLRREHATAAQANVLRVNVEHEISRRRQKSLEERMDAGRALRKQVPRSIHENWTSPRDQIDPIEILEQSNRGRIPELISVRHSRMSKSPFTFFRGLAGLMAADFASSPSTGIMVQACGDCHLLNFGGFATPERNMIFDINDFDETILAPWEWDLKRLTVSAVLAGREMHLSQGRVLDATQLTVESYRLRMRELASMSPLDIWYSKAGLQDYLGVIQKKSRRQRLERRVQKEQARNNEFLFPRLTQITKGQTLRIIDNPPLIYHPKGFEAFENQMEKFFDEYCRSLNPELRVLLLRYRLIDFALKVVGIGSVGTRCAVALLMGENGDPLFLQFKQARRSVLQEYAGMKSSFNNEGQRVVAGQRLMQSASDMFLGWNSHAARFDFYFRQLRDSKISVDLNNLTEEAFVLYLRFCGRVLAEAHARSGDPAMIAGYMGKSGVFVKAVANFALAYADQTVSDYAVFLKAMSSGRLAANESISPSRIFDLERKKHRTSAA